MTSPSSLLRVIYDDALDGPTNMARDEALLTLVGEGESVPTLRTYLWSPPTISLGYFQRYADYVSLAPPAGQLPVVRRQTGGGAILHDRELTYSITLPLKHPLLAGGGNALYEIAHDALMECLKERGVQTHRSDMTDGSGPARGPFFCFVRRHRLDVMLGGGKLAGSAQRRTRKAVLQHGSIML
ncbi:MAG: lipoate--protein ligase, partial [Phycisphaerae bacterium]|nr:lipoate--protein ligase [Phycisphaerae bacterium]